MIPSRVLFVEPLAIRARNMHAYRSGEWAMLTCCLLINQRPCYQVIFNDGATDYWEMQDPAADYEFGARRLRSIDATEGQP